MTFSSVVACLLLINNKLIVYVPACDQCIEIKNPGDFEFVVKERYRGTKMPNLPIISAVTKTKAWLRIRGYSSDCFLEYRIISI